MRQPSTVRLLRCSDVHEFRIREAAVPYIYPELLNCTVYLYKSDAEATAGSQFGGSGILICVPYEDAPTTLSRVPTCLYVVTAAHVAINYPVVRVNRKTGNPPAAN